MFTIPAIMRQAKPSTAPRKRFLLLVYRMPAKPTRGRVWVWRSLKKLGALYLQDSVCVLPDGKRTRNELAPIVERIGTSRGSYHLMPIRTLPADEERKLVEGFVAQSAKHYDEIIENCEVNFAKEIEFEHFRQNYTYAEAEEIRMEFEKIGHWFDRVVERDWFGAPNRSEARRWLDRCERMLEEFEAQVFAQDARRDTGRPPLEVVRSAEAGA
jgi:hypothetical protein